MGETQRVFISYAHADYAFVERLRADLRRARISVWIDAEGLAPGTPSWEKAIRQAIEDSRAVVWVVSPASFESVYVRDEIAIARMKKCTIYPLWAEGENWMECVPLGTGQIQYADLRDDRYPRGLDELLAALNGTRVELAAPEETTPKLPPGKEPRNPYKGLAAFTEADAGDFFGREALIEKLRGRLVERLTADRDRLLTVIGPSGAGKSSVVLAGLIPALKRGGLEGSPGWSYLPPIVPGAHPLEALTDALSARLPDKALSAIEADLRSPGGRYLHRLAKQLPGGRAVLYIDQFEEVFTLTTDEAERQQFIDLLTSAVSEPGGPLIVLLTLRADFYGHPMHYPQLGALINAHHESVLPMRISELREAIEKPARLPDVGLTFDDGLVADIIFALRERGQALAGALPLLEFTLARLYAEREGVRLTRAAYDDMGGVEGAIGKHSEVVFTALDESAQAAFTPVFSQLVNIDETSGEPTRKRALLKDVTAEAASKTLIDGLVSGRLLMTDQDGYVGITHEALLRSWGRLAEWIAARKDDLRLIAQAERDAHDWDRQGRIYRPWGAERLKLLDEALQRSQREFSDPLVLAYTEPEQRRLLRELQNEQTDSEHRRDIGDQLALIGTGDLPEFKGMEVTDGLPDIAWCPVDGGEITIEKQRFEVKPFLIARHLITYAQFETFLQAEDGFANPEWWQDFPQQHRRQIMESQRSKLRYNPRDNVSWYQAVAFTRWLDFRYREAALTPGPSPERSLTLTGRGEQALTPNPSPERSLTLTGRGEQALTPGPSPSGRGESEVRSARGKERDGYYRELASKAMVQVARELRQRQTDAEAILWECLRDRRLGDLKFRRQHPIAQSTYVVDFCCYEQRLVIELDGGVHATQREADAARQRDIESLGYRVLRFPNNQIFNDLESVLTTLLHHSDSDSPLPVSVSERSGEGPGVRAFQLRLPTEWEWQWAAQNGKEARAYPWGEWGENRANTLEVGLSRTTAVGVYPAGAAACGALDMAGNVWEWCLNDYENPGIVGGYNNEKYKVLRGGSFLRSQGNARASFRNGDDPSIRYDYYGFRVVVAAPILQSEL